MFQYPERKKEVKTQKDRCFNIQKEKKKSERRMNNVSISWKKKEVKTQKDRHFNILKEKKKSESSNLRRKTDVSISSKKKRSQKLERQMF